MTVQGLRISFFVVERFRKILHGVFTTIAFGVCLLLLAGQFNSIQFGLGRFFERLGQIEHVELFNIKAAFEKSDGLEKLSAFNGLTEIQKAELLSDVSDIKTEWFARLLNAGALKGLCDYERPDEDMITALVVDRKLETMGLAQLDPAPKAKAEALRNMRAAGADWKIGAPRSCYDLTLTRRGWRLKAAILEYLTLGLATTKTPAIEARKSREARRLARADIE